MRAIIHDGPWTYEVHTSGEHWEKVGDGKDDYEERFTYHVATITPESRSVFWQPRYDEDGKVCTYVSERSALAAGVTYLLSHLDEIKHVL